jgi:hypothetical protein
VIEPPRPRRQADFAARAEDRLTPLNDTLRRRGIFVTFRWCSLDHGTKATPHESCRNY